MRFRVPVFVCAALLGVPFAHCATVVVGPGHNLQNAIRAAAPGDTILGAAFDGILLTGASCSRVAGNAVSGFLNHGIFNRQVEASEGVDRGND